MKENAVFQGTLQFVAVDVLRTTQFIRRIRATNDENRLLRTSQRRNPVIYVCLIL